MSYLPLEVITKILSYDKPKKYLVLRNDCYGDGNSYGALERARQKFSNICDFNKIGIIGGRDSRCLYIYDITHTDFNNIDEIRKYLSRHYLHIKLVSVGLYYEVITNLHKDLWNLMKEEGLIVSDINF